ncbi:hypothetical protein CERSUDRAFT_99906 [Gelatoporia subvermispora B]|uniref:Uncharacterized protein n=1 Tax=Ceriporiopsis subvermispora (strain B) TaxID=914234 RepID=M2Q566_CERS8|nr:hypothetical protein CERSUDRAFT_99906 [Gelatoporia subvermispora B]
MTAPESGTASTSSSEKKTREPLGVGSGGWRAKGRGNIFAGSGRRVTYPSGQNQPRNPLPTQSATPSSQAAPAPPPPPNHSAPAVYG